MANLGDSAAPCVQTACQCSAVARLSRRVERVSVTTVPFNHGTTVIATERHKSKKPSLWILPQGEIQCRYGDQAIHHAPGEPGVRIAHTLAG